MILFFMQERLLFFPHKMSRHDAFQFNRPYEELFFTTEDGTELNGVLFKSDSAKGMIFYLHGNGGSIASWGEIAGLYTQQQYDCFLLDYRGYGKSMGSITSEKQLHEDVQFVFDKLKPSYQHQQIIVLGYSLGTGLAARLASVNDVSMLILQAPYYSMKAVMKDHYPIIPPFILRYKLETHKYMKQCTMPIALFHGTSDRLIDHRSSIRLKELLKPSDTLILLTGQGHNEMSDNPQYVEAFINILNRR